MVGCKLKDDGKDDGPLSRE